MLLDANILLYAIDRESPHHEPAQAWVEQALTGARRVGLPWQTIGAVIRIATHPKVMRQPLDASQAWQLVEAWLAAPVTWIPPASLATASLLGELVLRHGLTANLVPDGQLAALALEHGLTVVSADTDFARFTEVRWHNPVAG